MHGTVLSRQRQPPRGASGALGLWLAVAAAAAEAACPSGLAPGGALAGDLGPAPSRELVELACLEIRNDGAIERFEIARSGIPIPRGLGLTTAAGLVVVGPGERLVAAQFEVLSRWGGPPDAAALPIRFLEVAVPARVAAAGLTRYALRLVSQPSAPGDPYAVRVEAQGGLWEIDTGVATFLLDPANPALFERISIDPDDDGAGRLIVYDHAAGAGPRLAYDGDGAIVTLGTAVPGQVVVDAGGFEIDAAGPVRAVVTLRGHFQAADGSSRCRRGGLDYERFGFTVVAGFHRASRDVRLDFHFRNECSDAQSGPWTDDAATVHRVSWELPLGLAPARVWWAGAGAPATSGADFSGAVRVEQRRGGGSPWRRRAWVRRDGVTEETAEAFERPLVAVAGTDLVAALQMPWMRYREPQALAVVEGDLSLLFVAAPLVVGEGKGLWSSALVSLRPAAQFPTPPTGGLEDLRIRGSLELERGLLVWPGREAWNSARATPGLGTASGGSLETAYREVMDALHEETVLPGGQWDRAKTYGSQLWPDTRADPWLVDVPADPSTNSGAMNYWNPSGAELVEFARTGEPRWVWDFALPQSRLQAHTAYLNIGDQGHGNRGGFAVTSGGDGEGQWHRSAFGSDDYSYDMGLWLAYLARPSPALRHRFRQAGRTAVERYGVPEGGGRERWVSEVDLTRQVLQHLWLLADCAEFVPGSAGRACHDRLAGLVAELAGDNLSAGVLCQGDDPPDPCATPQQFMQNALMLPFLHRLYRNYGDALGELRRALVEAPWNLYRHGLAKQSDGITLDVGGDWAAGLVCDLDAARTAVVGCIAAPDSDGNLSMYAPTRPHTAAMLLLAHEVDPAVGLCGIAKAALDDPSMTAGWQDFLANESGWWKGAAQMMQAMAYGVGLYDLCRDGAQAELSLTVDNDVDTVPSGATVRYAIEVRNRGPAAAAGAVVRAALDGGPTDAAMTTWTCSIVPGSPPGSACPGAGGVAALTSGVAVDLAVGGAVRFALDVPVDASATGRLGVAAVVDPGATFDPWLGDNAAIDLDPLLDCGPYPDLRLAGRAIGAAETHQACVEIAAGPDLRILPSGAVTLRAGQLVVLENGVVLEPGAELGIEIGPPRPRAPGSR